MLTQGLPDVSPLIQATILSVLRIESFFFFSPLSGGRALPHLCRFSMALALSICVIPAVYADLSHRDPGNAEVVLLMVKEAGLGMFLGLLVWFPLRGLELVGVIIDTQRGATMGEDFNPLLNTSTTPISNFLGQAFNGFFFSTGGFLVVIGMLYSSMEIWSVGAPFPGILEEAKWLYMTFAGQLFTAAIVTAIPICSLMLIADISIGFLAKKAQELQPLVLGMPVKTTIVLIALIFYIGLLFPNVMSSIQNGLDAFLQVMGDE